MASNKETKNENDSINMILFTAVFLLLTVMGYIMANDYDNTLGKIGYVLGCIGFGGLIMLIVKYRKK